MTAIFVNLSLSLCTRLPRGDCSREGFEHGVPNFLIHLKILEQDPPQDHAEPAACQAFHSLPSPAAGYTVLADLSAPFLFSLLRQTWQAVLSHLQ